jgi:ferredoxin
MANVKFVVEHQVVEAKSGQKLRGVAQDAGINIDRELFRGLNCRGLGLCGSCKVWVHPGDANAVNSPSLWERIHGLRGGRRLACQVRVMGDVEVTTMPGGDDRLGPKRDIDPPPNPATDPDAARKPIDEASSIAHPLGHPSAVGKGEAPKQVDKPAAAPAKEGKGDKGEGKAAAKEPAEAPANKKEEQPAADKPVAGSAEAKADKPWVEKKPADKATGAETDGGEKPGGASADSA